MKRYCGRLLLELVVVLSLESGITTGFALKQIPRERSSLFLGSPTSGKYDIPAALAKLPWEILEDLNQKPLVNLSSKDQRLEVDSRPQAQTGSWDQGQRWSETKNALQERGIAADDCFLEKCPQLLRLDPSMVLKTADWVIQVFGAQYLESEPRLLTYREEQAQYGLEFLSTMMMMDAMSACRASPSLMISGIDGGIQEKAVSSALGAAGAATSKASQAIATDTMVALQALQKKRPK
jgi:hypothetical protein